MARRGITGGAGLVMSRMSRVSHSEPVTVSSTSPGRRQRRWLAVTLLVLIEVTLAYALTVPGFQATPFAALRRPWVAGSVLVGVILLFSLYVLAKHDELERLRRIEEAEREEVEALRIRLAEIAALFDAAVLLSLHPDVGRMLELVCRRVVAALDVDVAAVLLLDAEGKVLEVRARDGKRSAVAADLRIPVSEGAIGRVARSGRSAVLDAAELAGPPARAEHALGQLGAVAVVPVRLKAQIAGVLLAGGGTGASGADGTTIPLADERSITALGLFAESLGSALSRLEREQRIGGRNSVLERANRELVDHNRQTEVFLATATHELRTPLSGILSYAEVLADYYDTLADDERRSIASSLNHQCQTMMGLVEELFDFARLESGRLTLDAEPTRASELVSSAVDLMAAVAAEHGLRFERQIAELGPVVLDPTKIRQCVLNLLSNAIKFTPAGGTISVRLTASAEGIEVAVADTGQGIPAEELDRVFELFYSGAGRGGQKSLGLGLYLVRSFVELHGGKVWVRSRPGEGSTFAFAVPWHSPRANLEPESRAA